MVAAMVESGDRAKDRTSPAPVAAGVVVDVARRDRDARAADTPMLMVADISRATELPRAAWGVAATESVAVRIDDVERLADGAGATEIEGARL